MLIVNADDLGRDFETSEAILEVHRAGLISSASVMVFSADTERAIAAAKRQDLRLGLHLNVTDRFTAADVDPALRAVQDRVRGSLGRYRRRYRWAYDPRLRGPVGRSLAAQLAEFERLAGQLPTHLDGHRHAHSALNVIVADRLRVGLPMRRVVIDNRATHPVIRALGLPRQRLANRRFAAAWRLLTLTGFFDERTAARSRALLESAAGLTVEVSVHPGVAREREMLESEMWRRLSEPFEMAGYDALR